MISWTRRADRRGAGAILFRPPEAERSALKWHLVDTPAGRMRLQWRPGIDVWLDTDGGRWPSEVGGALGFTYVGEAQDSHERTQGQSDVCGHHAP